MRSNLGFKAAIVAIVIAFGVFKLVPSVQFHSMSKEERKAKEDANDPAFAELKSKALNLGLDLQGGMRVVVEIDVKEFLLRRANRKDDVLREAVSKAANDEFSPIETLQSALTEKGKSLVDYYGDKRNLKRDTDEKILPILNDEIVTAAKQALEIIRNRVDAFGVAEPTIQLIGTKRIAVELAGVSNQARVRSNIQREAQLFFSMVPESNIAKRVFDAANEFYAKKYNVGANDSSKTEEKTDAEALFGADETSDEKKDDTSYDETLFITANPQNFQQMYVTAKNHGLLEDLLKDDEFQKHVQSRAGSYKLQIMKPRGLEPNQRPEIYTVIATEERVHLTGEGIEKATAVIDPDGVNQYVVSMKFDDKTGRKFSYLSKRYLNKRLAISLDGIVQSAPTFVTEIPAHSGAQITGMNQQEAQDLSIVLRSGALPAPLKIIEEFTTSASLGEDSVKAGTNSILIGFALVLVFMMVYYKKSGIIASLAVVINVVLMFAALAAFGGTLTLPGIAGLILTIGMSVDANVLIFERIREEVTGGVTVFQALENGYARAFIAIADANITTFIAGVVLYSFGSGTIRGFALILMIGILTSMFTAIVMTKVIFAYTTKETEKQLSI